MISGMSRIASLITGVEELPDGRLAHIRGEIDYSRSPEFRGELAAVIKGGPKRLVLDMSGVPYMDSSSIAVLVETLQNQRRAGGKLVLCCLQSKVRSVFEIARLNAVFRIVDDRDAALKA